MRGPGQRYRLARCAALRFRALLGQLYCLAAQSLYRICAFSKPIVGNCRGVGGHRGATRMDG